MGAASETLLTRVKLRLRRTLPGGGTLGFLGGDVPLGPWNP